MEVQPPRAVADCNSLRHHAQVDLTNVDDDSSSGDEAIRRRRLQPAVPRDADDDEADSRYALNSRREGKAKRLKEPTKRRTAELKFEEDGLEEVDKADHAVANVRQRASTQAKKCLPSPSPLVNDVVSGRLDEGHAPLASKRRENKVKRKVVSALGRPSKVVMFTAIEATEVLSLYQGGTMSIPAKIDPHSRQPYPSLQTGERLSYPVKGTYHLGSTGRYGIDTVPPPLPLRIDCTIIRTLLHSGRPCRLRHITNQTRSRLRRHLFSPIKGSIRPPSKQLLFHLWQIQRPPHGQRTYRIPPFHLRWRRIL